MGFAHSEDGCRARPGARSRKRDMPSGSNTIHPELAALRDFWDEKRGDRRMPARADIDVQELKRWLGHLALLDVVDGGRDFVFRVHGVDLVELYGVDLTGKALSEAGSAVEAVVLDEYRSVVDEKAPLFVKRHHAQPEKDFVGVSKLILPLSSDGETVDMILFGYYIDK